MGDPTDEAGGLAPCERPTRLFLVRHGEVEGAGGGLHGHVDVPLTDRGRDQAQRVAAWLADQPLAAVYSSDLVRAREGAEAVARRHGLRVVETTAFRELHMGRWDGRLFSELWVEERDLLEQWWADLEAFIVPGGESLRDLSARVLETLREVLAAHRGKSLCLVAHGGVNRVVLFDALGLPLGRFHALAQDYGCINLVEYFPDGKAVVQLANLRP